MIEPLSREEFENPSVRSRMSPFWFWNGDMSEDCIRRQVQQMADAGLGGFFIHGRQGLTLPYLSDEWFSRVRLAVDLAHERGLEAWLYDECPYPSGIAGGLLTATHPDFRARVLERSDFLVEGEAPCRREFNLGRVVSAWAFPVEQGSPKWESPLDLRKYFGVVLTRELFWRWPMAHIPYNEKRFMADEGRLVLQWTPPPGQWRVFVAVEVDQRGFKYFDCYFDPLQTGAAQAFIESTHERYAEHLSKYFGNTIPGIFTDETEPPSWSSAIEAELGNETAALLPALYFDEHPQAIAVRQKFRQCALRLFQERWEKPIVDWCAQHNLIWAAEKPTWRPSQFWNIAQPSTDAGHRRIGLAPEPLTTELRANHRAAMAAAEQCGTEEVRCECFHSLGWGATLQDQKWTIDWLAVQGVNRFTPHAFYATSSGLTKHDAAPSFFAENPYWKYFGRLADYTGRLSVALSRGHEVARIAVLHPTASLWCGGEIAKHIREEYEWLMNTLLAEHHIFHPVDALALSQATPAEGALNIGHACYQTLCVPPLALADAEMESAIRAALDAGLQVLIAEPFSQLGAVDASAWLNWTGVTPIRSREEWKVNLEPPRALSIHDGTGQQIHDVWAVWRRAHEQEILFVANTSNRDIEAHVICATGATTWEQWLLEDGSIQLQASQIVDHKVQMSIALPPFGSALLMGSCGESSAIPATLALPRVLVLPMDGQLEITLDRPNSLRLNRWRVACDDGDWSGEADDAHWPEVEALPLRYRDQVERKWKQTVERRENLPIWYRRHIQCDVVPEDLVLLLENGAILGDWTVWINGTQLKEDAFGPFEFHGSDKVFCRVASLFRCGANSIALRVDNAPEMGGLRTPLHLVGEFGLGGSDHRTLTSLPRQSAFQNLTEAGLPHFSGTVTYRQTLTRQTFAGFEAVELPRGFADIAELSLNGQVLGVRTWSPYVWRLPSELPEKFDLKIAVTNTLLPFVEGQQWDAEVQVAQNV
jgi:hypothetical protein